MSTIAGVLSAVAASVASAASAVGAAVGAGIAAVGAVGGAIAGGTVAGLTIGTVAAAISTVATVASLGLTVAGAITGDKSLMDAAFWTGIGAAVTGGVASIANSATSASTSSLASTASSEAATAAGADIATNAGGTTAGVSVGSQVNAAITPTFESAANAGLSSAAKAAVPGALGNAGTQALANTAIPDFASSGTSSLISSSANAGKAPSAAESVSQQAMGSSTTPAQFATKPSLVTDTSSNLSGAAQDVQPTLASKSTLANNTPSLTDSATQPSTFNSSATSNPLKSSSFSDLSTAKPATSADNLLAPKFESNLSSPAPNVQSQAANIGSKSDLGISDVGQKSIGSTDAMGNVNGAATSNSDNFFSDLWSKGKSVVGGASDALQQHSVAAKLFSDLLGSMSTPDEKQIAQMQGDQARQAYAFKAGLGSITSGVNSPGAYYVDNMGRLQRA